MATHTYGPEAWVLAMSFKARIVDGEPRPADDVAKIRPFSAGEANGSDSAWEHDREFVRSAPRSGGDER